jgi:predicted DNA-binding transcriptional regulator AlpA
MGVGASISAISMMARQLIECSEKDELLRIEKVSALVGLSRTEIYRRIKLGRFPAAERVDGVTYWRRSAIAGWIHTD